MLPNIGWEWEGVGIDEPAIDALLDGDGNPRTTAWKKTLRAI